MNSSDRVFLVSCVGQKLNRAAAAADLYQSDWFKKAREYVELERHPWFILSALHGLVKPDQIISPYNVTLKGQKKADRRAWAGKVFAQIRAEIAPDSHLWILAGKSYRDPLETLLQDAGYRVHVPMRGLGIGKQLRWLKENIASLKKGQN